MKRVMLLAATLGLAAVLLPAGVSAAPEDLDTIARECPKRLKMSPEKCECVKNNASKLTDGQQKYVAAIMLKDKAAKKKAAKALPPAELTQIEKMIKGGGDPCKAPAQ